MTCADRELELALYAGGELPAEEVAALELHLEMCAHCRDVAREFLQNREAMALAGHVEDEVAVTLVRQRVMAKLRRGRVAVFAGIAAALVIATFIGALWMQRGRSIAELPVVAKAPGAPVLTVTSTQHPVAPRSIRHDRRFLAPAAVKPEAPAKDEVHVMVKIETEDPDIVVYWITD